MNFPNCIHEKSTNELFEHKNYEKWFEYDENNHLIFEKHDDGYVKENVFDSNNHLIYSKIKEHNEIHEQFIVNTYWENGQLKEQIVYYPI